MQSQSEVVIFAGPHGTGKDTLEQMFTEAVDGAVRNVRYATRMRGPDEVNGLTYHFITPEQFGAMARRGDFIEEAEYPDGSTATSLPDLQRQILEHRYVCLTMNFADGLLLSERLGNRGVPNKCLFVGPCSEEDMLNSPDTYLGALRVRMLRRQRPTDDVTLRLTIAMEYRQLYIANRQKALYIGNEDGGQQEAIQQITSALGW